MAAQYICIIVQIVVEKTLCVSYILYIIISKLRECLNFLVLQ